MKTLIINDPHLGVKRQGGTTPESRKALEDWMFGKFEDLLSISHDELIILGDLFDSRTVPEHVMMRTIGILKDYSPTIVLGNHDLGGVGGGPTISSAEMVAEILGEPAISQPTQWSDHIYIVPHMFDQEAHERAIADCPEGVWLLTHCNIDSPFSQGDHSLNLSKEEIENLDKKNVQVLAAHEHARRDYMNNVTIIGNQFPSSISDCTHGVSFAGVISDDGDLETMYTWTPEVDFQDCDYTDINNLSESKFIRLNGECGIAEYASVVREMAQLRKESDAFIISNNVNVKLSDTMIVTAEEVTNFNILELLLERVEKEFREDIKACI